jgi:hypothetical protein
MHIIDKKAMFLFAFVLLTGTLVKGQTENTRERLITQLKNGTAPGLQFAPAQPVVAPAGNNNSMAQQQKESLITQIRKGTAPGMKFQGGAGVTGARAAAPVAAGTSGTTVGKQGPLASEMDIPKALPKTLPAPVVPAQEEVAPAAPVGKQN